MLQGMEVYSTVLWHMKREVDLANLAHEAVQLDWHAPQAWVVMGNCFSLQKVGSRQRGMGRAWQAPSLLASAACPFAAQRLAHRLPC